MERGEGGPGRGAHGLPGRRRRGYGPRDVTEGAGGGGVNGLEDVEDNDYGQLLRRPGEQPPHQQRLRPPGGPRTPAPGRFVPSADHPVSGPPLSGPPPNGFPPGGFPADGNLANRGAVPSGTAPAGPANGGPVPGRQYRAPDARLNPPDADRPYRPAAHGPADGNPARPRPTRVRVPGQDALGGIRGRPGGPPQAPGPPRPGTPGAHQAYGHAPGSRGASGVSGNSGFATSQAPQGIRDVPIPPDPLDLGGRVGPVIRQRETAVPDEPPPGQKKPMASIAPDGLESFARDLRVMRATAGLDYPEMAELSHYTMRTLASAAAGLRLPTLPVAVAYVRACGGDVAEWEERWQKLATKITADAARNRRNDGGDQQASPEPFDSPAIAEPPAGAAAAQDPDPDPGKVYVITSAKPRQPGWPAGPGGPAEAEGTGEVWGFGGPRG